MSSILDRLMDEADDELMADSMGNAFTYGWYALFPDDLAILTEKLDKTSVKVYDSYGDLMIAWKSLEDECINYAEEFGIN